jgi:hypothetical protein
MHYGSSTRLTTLLGLCLGRIPVVHSLPSGAAMPRVWKNISAGANTELYQDARLTCYETKTTRCGSSTKLSCRLGWEKYISLGLI